VPFVQSFSAGHRATLAGLSSTLCGAVKNSHFCLAESKNCCGKVPIVLWKKLWKAE
jgi:hypothetical protein